MFPIRDLNPTRIRPVITLAIIAANVLIFFLWQPGLETSEGTAFAYERAAIACELTTGTPLSVTEINTGQCLDDGAAPYFADKQIWLSALVSMFLHGSLFHLLSNMWFLWIFGNNVEEAFGRLGYLALYVIAGIVGTAAFVLANPNETVPLVGASGAIAGVLGAYLVLYPTHRVLTLFTVIFVPVPAILFLGFWFFGQFAFQVEGVASEAHVGGFIAGLVIALILRGTLLRRVDDLHRPVRWTPAR